MLRKIMVFAMAIGALAAPSMAGAQVLEDEEEPVEVGATMLATSINFETLTGSGTISCKKTTLDLTVDLNVPGSATATGNGTAANCSITENGAPVTITSVTISHLTLGGGSGSVSLQFTADIAGVLECTFSTNATDKVAIAYIIPSDSIRFAGTVAGAGAGCPLTGLVSGDFTVETGNGTPIILTS